MNALIPQFSHSYKGDMAPQFNLLTDRMMLDEMTLEVNTSSHEQCVTAHLERNASRELLQEIRKSSNFLPGKEIKEIDYLAPFDIRKRF